MSNDPRIIYRYDTDGTEVRITRETFRNKDTGFLQFAVWNGETWCLKGLDRAEAKRLRNALIQWLGEDN